jgi:predicted transcriptional regulator
MPEFLPRPDLYVVSRLLEALSRQASRMRKTPLQMATGVNYTIFSRYLLLLEKRGLVKVTKDSDDTDWVELTPKGSEALKYLNEGMQRVLEPNQ